jgi:hypothetical protein
MVQEEEANVFSLLPLSDIQKRFAGLALGTVEMNIPLAPGGPVQLLPGAYQLLSQALSYHTPWMAGPAPVYWGQSSWERIRRLWGNQY